MSTYTGWFFTILIIINILLILVGFGANPLIEAQTAKTLTVPGSSTTRDYAVSFNI
jgi:hypothetical protein